MDRSLWAFRGKWSLFVPVQPQFPPFFPRCYPPFVLFTLLKGKDM